MSKSKSKTKKKAKSNAQDPNKVSYDHFKRAVELAKECKPEPDKIGKPFPRVGVVIVKNGMKVSEAYRGEIGVGQHAEYIALEKKAGDKPEVKQADLITTLEPCTIRSHDKQPCVSWIKSRNIRKVWIATLDYNPKIAGLGELELQKAGILIGRFPDDLAAAIIEANKDFFDWIQSKQPSIPDEEQKSERLLILDRLSESRRSTQQWLELLTNKALQPVISKKRSRELERTFDDFISQNNSINKATNLAMAVQLNNVGSWIQLGDGLFTMHMYGAASLSYRVATEIDATSKVAWEGLIRSDLNLNRTDMYWPFQYSIEKIDTSPLSLRSITWLDLAKDEKSIDVKLRMAARSLQLGHKLDDVWAFVEDVSVQTLKQHQKNAEREFSRRGLEKYEELLIVEGNAWKNLGDLIESFGETERKDFCYGIIESIRDLFKPNNL
ncbi:MAG: hypothetical protein ACXADD_14110 [Candidatus Thorarchaeota archaeon]